MRLWTRHLPQSLPHRQIFSEDLLIGQLSGLTFILWARQYSKWLACMQSLQQYYYQSHFKDDEPEMLSNFPKFTQLLSGIVGFWICYLGPGCLLFTFFLEWYMWRDQYRLGAQLQVGDWMRALIKAGSSGGLVAPCSPKFSWFRLIFHTPLGGEPGTRWNPRLFLWVDLPSYVSPCPHSLFCWA
jgi:hypothetical protein